MTQVTCVSTIGNLAVLGAQNGFEFINLSPLKYINYRNPNSNTFSKLMNKVRGKKENEDTSGFKMNFKCDVIFNVNFGLDSESNFNLLYGGKKSKYLTRISFNGPFEFLESRAKNVIKKRSSSIFSKKSFLNPGNESNKSLSKGLSFTSMFSFNQNESELKKVFNLFW
jgi:hypothetical protein